MRIISVGFVVCFGLGGFATPSISIYSQLHHLQSLEHILNDPNTQRTKTKGEIINLSLHTIVRYCFCKNLGNIATNIRYKAAIISHKDPC